MLCLCYCYIHTSLTIYGQIVSLLAKRLVTVYLEPVGSLYQCGNETMAKINRGLLLLVPIRRKAVSSDMQRVFDSKKTQLINPFVAADW